MIWESGLALTVYTCLQVLIYSELGYNRIHWGNDYWLFFVKLPLYSLKRTINHALAIGSLFLMFK